MSNGHLFQRHDFRLLPKFVSKVQHEDERDIEICREERFCVPIAVDEDSVASGEEDDGEGDESCPCGVRLKGTLPWQLVATDALFLQAIVKAKVDEADDDPLDESSGGDEVLEPCKHGRSAVGQGPSSDDMMSVDAKSRDKRNAHTCIRAR